MDERSVHLSSSWTSTPSAVAKLPLWTVGAFFIAGVVLIVTYVMTRNRGSLRITSPGQTAITVLIEDAPSAVTFLDRVQEVKLVHLGRVRKPTAKAVES